MVNFSSTFALGMCTFLGKEACNLGRMYEQQMFCWVSQFHYCIYFLCFSCSQNRFRGFLFGQCLIFPLFHP